MKNAGQIAFAGAVAGLVFCGTLLILGVSYLWLAFGLGFTSGYLAYEFEEVRDAASAFAWSLRQGFQEWRSDARQWLKEPHPYLLISSPVWLGAWCCFSYLAIVYLAQRSESALVFVPVLLLALGMITLLVAVIGLLASAVVTAFVHFGADCQNAFFVEPDVERNLRDHPYLYTDPRVEMSEKGYVEHPFTYSNALYWFIGGCFEVFFLVAITWFGLVPFVIWLASLLLQLFVRIHSSKRLMCGSGGVIGGWIAHALFWNAEMSFWQAGLYLLAGALFGACAALLEWKASQVLARGMTPAPA